MVTDSLTAPGPVDALLLVGRDPDDAVAFQIALAPACEVFREAGDEGERRREEIEAALNTGLAHY